MCYGLPVSIQSLTLLPSGECTARVTAGLLKLSNHVLEKLCYFYIQWMQLFSSNLFLN
jgi:hypothetical protein